jgi:hypothetical protein
LDYQNNINSRWIPNPPNPRPPLLHCYPPPLPKVRLGEKKVRSERGGVPWTRACFGQGMGGTLLHWDLFSLLYLNPRHQRYRSHQHPSGGEPQKYCSPNTCFRMNSMSGQLITKRGPSRSHAGTHPLKKAAGPSLLEGRGQGEKFVNLQFFMTYPACI